MDTGDNTQGLFCDATGNQSIFLDSLLARAAQVTRMNVMNRFQVRKDFAQVRPARIFFPAFPWIIHWLIWGYLTLSVCYKLRSREGWWYLGLSCALFIACNC